MRDPHVVALHYRLVTGETLAFKNAPPVERATEAFRLRLADDRLAVEMKEHYATERQATEQVEPDLRAWEIDVALREEPGFMRFIFERAEVVDRNPPPPRTDQALQVGLKEVMIFGETVSVRITRAQYPEPPGEFVISPDVETMWRRYEGYRAGKEPLAAMAYMCLTVLEASAGGRKNKRGKAARQYSVDAEVLSTLGHLTTEVGDAQTARKVICGRKLRPHTSAEISWIEGVIKALIRRAGEWTANPNAARPRITLKEFSPI